MRRLLLVGGGHAHLAVLRALARHPLGPTWEVVLLSPSERHHYSGMLPALLRGAVAEPEIAVDLRPLCRAAGARFIRAAADDVDGHARTVRTPLGPLEFDLASLDVGAEPAFDAPGAREHAHVARPIARAVALEPALAGVAPGSAVCVVGGGAAGVEVALAIRARLHELLHDRLRARDPGATVTLVERAGTLLPGERPRLRRLAARVLARHGVRVLTGAPVGRVHPDAIGLASGGGESIPSTFTVWLTGASPGPVLLDSALPKSADGWLLVDRTLRAVDGAPVWGAGDCVSIRDDPWTPKSGVYAVRAGPVLAHNLRAAIDGRPPRPFVPRRHTLAILDTADGRALLRWGPISYHGRTAWWLKRWIDTRFVASYRLGDAELTSRPPPPTRPAPR